MFFFYSAEIRDTLRRFSGVVAVDDGDPLPGHDSPLKTFDTPQAAAWAYVRGLCDRAGVWECKVDAARRLIVVNEYPGDREGVTLVRTDHRWETAGDGLPEAEV